LSTDSLLVAYGSVFAGWLCLGAACLMQAIMVDIAGIRSHHTPGMPVTTGHDDFFFRATRAQANTNETLAVFALLSLAAVVLGASPWWTKFFVWIFVAARLGHMLAYYADLRTLRSASFGIGLVCLVALLVLGITALA
jgi:uncharacterized MAPEG superfamily protein